MIPPGDSHHRQPPGLACVEICAGAGGQALGLERAGFQHTTLVELDGDAVRTLRRNRPHWNVLHEDARGLSPARLWPGGNEQEVALLAAGVPCPPFSLAGQQLGAADERDLFPDVLALAAGLKPRAVLIENVKGILQAKFDGYRANVLRQLKELGYTTDWQLLRACDFGVPQLRPRAVLVAMRPASFTKFAWPTPTTCPDTAPSVGSVLCQSMASRGWELAHEWAGAATRIAPTLCGGSRKHGGADLGPSRARKAWAELGVNGSSVADAPPLPGTPLPVKLTVAQMALLQGFPPDWVVTGRKTAAYRQVGNAFPPPVAAAVGRSIATALSQTDSGIDAPNAQTGCLGSSPSATSLLGSVASPGVIA
ncbi:DNA (cytosine-5-)-methyltransferase [Streptomyces sp. NBC_00257]|uniref:DNA cytosine methyltransferase n=1 Tax=unclassified Streptomyces TaxID=2593676 RepID=UPI002251B8AB|nr:MULTISPECIES: DNA (cytosine-5-)-methyltransferase [unclassified Streptomyces]MCX5431408.1 DNA (cytosine-5-)-methyltransferase [Streptomyces sp. NBC_00062]WTB54540.1 DNA (cytosine-5-)-methyltransferase [Streptomyces sp. NBC_00826]WTH92573.1 DNA (cytosine-5-)-methyltransferase [Streptomyces sp. NBC_00825]WTI01304.1 DNA (cytosine-5-)-methyltransferase [Streptomyces sp. NBC_00822]